MQASIDEATRQRWRHTTVPGTSQTLLAITVLPRLARHFRDAREGGSQLPGLHIVPFSIPSGATVSLDATGTTANQRGDLASTDAITRVCIM
jgi:hypothetical protein